MVKSILWTVNVEAVMAKECYCHEAISEARQLIGLWGQKDELPATTREWNLNKAWHILDNLLKARRN